MNSTAGTTNTDKRHLPLRIERMPDGGFVVSDTPFSLGSNERFCGALFASSSIGEALAFIAGRLDPEALKALQEQQAKAAAASVDADRAKSRGRCSRSATGFCENLEGCGNIECSGGFAKPREASPDCRCARCGRHPQSGCVTCGRGMSIAEMKKFT